MRFTFLTFALFAAHCLAAEKAGNLDPKFASISFDRWSEKEGNTAFRWKTHIEPPRLGNHQRMALQIDINVDGLELLKRQGQGEVVLLIQLRDQAGRLYQNHNSIPLDKVNEDAGRTESQYNQVAYVVPGHYELSMGMFISGTKEHALVRKSVHVDSPAHDPLPDAWRDLPSVEFLPSADPPDSWYWPTVEGRLNLPLETRRPVHIELLVNESPTEEVRGVRMSHTQRLNMDALIPALKVFSQLKLSNGSLKIAMLELERQRVIFEQNIRNLLDWPKLHDALTDASPNVIDIGSLSNHAGNAQFFLSQVSKRLDPARSTEPLRVLIVLSGPMAFSKREDLAPIQATPNPNQKIFYIRYYSASLRLRPYGSGPQFGETPSGRAARRGDPRGLMPVILPLSSDELVRLLKPLDPHVFDVTDPIQFRKALATVLTEIAHLD